MKTIAATASALLLGLLAACNTIEGAGQDIEAGGQAISETSREVQDDIAE